MIDDLAMLLIDRSSRRSRRDVTLDSTPGLYALFLKPDCALPSLSAGDNSPIYLGKADGAGGLKARCHFNGGTRNHSPRKSLAVLLEHELNLLARPITNPDGSYKTWALGTPSERALDQWMHANLDVAYATAPGAVAFEKALIQRFQPILNLTDCAQNDARRQVTSLRKNMEERMRRILQKSQLR